MAMSQSLLELPVLWSHQETMLNNVRAAMARYRRVVLQAPPGTGKTRLSKYILTSYSNRPQLDGESGHALFAVHRRGLVDNASNSFNERPRLPHGLIMSQRKTNSVESVQVGSIDTVNAWYVDDASYTGTTFDIVVFDETHSHVSKLRTMLAAHDAKRAAHNLRPTFVLGLSATPQNKELHEVYSHIVRGPSPQWLIDNKFLKPFRYFSGTHGKASKLVKRGDDYTEQSISEAMEGLAGDMVRDWLNLAAGRATVGFFPRRTHAQEAVELFVAAGVKAVYLDGNTPDEERLKMFDDLNNGIIDYIANVGIVERGTDIPRIGCVQMCVFVGSIVRWLQMIGRGSRLHPDVPDCLVLDHGDGVKKGWFFEDEVAWTLEWGDRPSKTHKAAPTIQCPQCSAQYRGGKCKCGYEPTKRERKSQGLDFIGGELVEIEKKDRKKSEPDSCEKILLNCLYRAGRSGRTVKQAIGMSFSDAKKQGTEFRVPAVFEVGSSRFKTVPYGHTDETRKVSDVYGFTVKNYDADANPWRLQ